jgi:hypothetical protein
MIKELNEVQNIFSLFKMMNSNEVGFVKKLRKAVDTAISKMVQTLETSK